MLRRALLLAALLGIACHVTEALQCIECRKNFDGDAACTAAGTVVECDDDEICTTNVHCDTKFRKYFEKGCFKARRVGANELNAVTCNSKNNRCEFFCDTPNCNEVTPEEAADRLKCNIMTPAPGPDCFVCDGLFPNETECLAVATVQTCEGDEVCTTDVHCDGPDAMTFSKGCRRRRQIEAIDVVVCNKKRNRCQFHCDVDECNQFVPEFAVTNLRRCNRVPPTTTPEPPGPDCVFCDGVYPTEQECLDASTVVSCRFNEVCTTDVHCDGPFAMTFSKGCRRRRQIEAIDVVVCNQKRNRCQFHCDEDECNTIVPEFAVTNLRRCNRMPGTTDLPAPTSPPPTSPPPTLPPSPPPTAPSGSVVPTESTTAGPVTTPPPPDKCKPIDVGVGKCACTCACSSPECPAIP